MDTAIEAIIARVKSNSSTLVPDAVINAVAECAAFGPNYWTLPAYPYVRIEFGQAAIWWGPGMPAPISLRRDESGRLTIVDQLVMQSVALRQTRLKLFSAIHRALMHGASS